MKNSPNTEKLAKILKSTSISASGFMGTDTRSFNEIIDADLAELQKLNYTSQQVAERMEQITNKATEGLGSTVQIDDAHQAVIIEAKGRIPCPWPHPGYFAKRVTELTDTSTGQKIHWSDLNIHLIAEHSFFEGHGSDFRIEPRQIIEMLF